VKLVVIIVCLFLFPQTVLADRCIDGVSCECVAFVADNGWGSLANNDAKDWWAAAQVNNEYQSGSLPRVGAVMVIDAWGDSGASKYGHVAIVKEIIDDKTILIDHANFDSADTVSLDRMVYDVSASPSHWQNIKIQWNDYNPGGTTYPVLGFIYPVELVTSQKESDHQENVEINLTNISVSLIIDRSGSMKDDNKLSKAVQAAKAFTMAMSDLDWISISSFSNDGNTELQLSSITNVKDEIDSKLSLIKASGGTNIGKGLREGFEQLSRSNNTQNTSLLLSDGADTTKSYYWLQMAKNFHEKDWPVCTVGFGNDAHEETLKKIAELTGCTYTAADTFDVIAKYQQLSAYVQGDSSVLAVSDILGVKGKNIYDFIVNAGSELINVFTNWFGSELKTILIDPSGNRIDIAKLTSSQGLYTLGKDFQNAKINKPQPGKWKLETSWAIAPKIPEQVNILVTEKSNIFSQILSFRPQYKKSESVTINVIAKELVGLKKIPLGQVSVKAKIQKPGEQMIRMVKAQSTNWSMYKDVVNNVTRELELFDDGQHDDYKAGDGIFGNTFQETDMQGAYLVTANITAQKNSGESIEKSLLASFQVGPISQNRVNNTQTLQYMGMASSASDYQSVGSNQILGEPLPNLQNVEAMESMQDFEHKQGSEFKNDINQMRESDPFEVINQSLESDPFEEIQQMQGSDPMDEINQMLRSQ